MLINKMPLISLTYKWDGFFCYEKAGLHAARNFNFSLTVSVNGPQKGLILIKTRWGWKFHMLSVEKVSKASSWAKKA